jgi:hypothetical protein
MAGTEAKKVRLGPCCDARKDQANEPVLGSHELSIWYP